MTLLPLKLLSLVWEPGVDPEIMPLDAEVGIDWIPSICVLSLIGLCLLVQIFYILRGDAKWQPPAPVEASPVAAAAVESMAGARIGVVRVVAGASRRVRRQPRRERLSR